MIREENKMETDSWSKADMKDYEDYKQEMKELRKQQELDRKEKREKAIFIRANIDKLKEEYIERFNKSFMYSDGSSYYNVRSAYHTLNKWLKMPERLKESRDEI